MPDYAEFRANTEACEALGRMTLALIRLESNLRTYLALNDVDVPGGSGTLDDLATPLVQHRLLGEGGVAGLSGLRAQRDYMTRNLSDFFCVDAGEGSPACRQVEGVSFLAQRAKLLEESVNHLAAMAEGHIAQLQSGAVRKGDLLFGSWRPTPRPLSGAGPVLRLEEAGDAALQTRRAPGLPPFESLSA